MVDISNLLFYLTPKVDSSVVITPVVLTLVTLVMMATKTTRASRALCDGNVDSQTIPHRELVNDRTQTPQASCCGQEVQYIYQLFQPVVLAQLKE